MAPRKAAAKAAATEVAKPGLRTAANQQKRVLRAAFVRHLERISCGGQIVEAVFHGNYAMEALTVDQLLFVTATGLADAPALTTPIGIVDVPLLAKASRLLADAEDKSSLDMAVYIQDHRLVLDDGARGIQRLVTATPSTVSTYLEPDVISELSGAAPDGEGFPLDRAVLARICAAFSLYKAEQMTLDFSKPGKVVVRVGGGASHAADFTLDVAEGLEDPGELLFGPHLKSVFDTLLTHGGTAPVMKCGERAVLIQDEGYGYMVSARMRPAEEEPAAPQPSTEEEGV